MFDPSELIFSGINVLKIRKCIFFSILFYFHVGKEENFPMHRFLYLKKKMHGNITDVFAMEVGI